MKKKIFIISILLLLIISLFSKEILAAPKITIQTFPQQIYKNEEFDITFDVTNDVTGSDSYYIKGRVGSSSATLNQGETFNFISNSWLSDASSWSNFPAVIMLNTNIATASVVLRTKITAITGINLITIRLNRNSTSYDSSASALLVLDPVPTPTPVITLLPTESLTPSPTDLPTSTPTSTPTSYNNIYISEIMTNPLAGENEWIELFNNNDFSVSLINWLIDDLENGGSSPKLFSLDIPAKSYGIVNLSSSMFNNTGDSVRLLDFNKILIDSFEYTGTAQGKSYGRISIDSDEFCLQEPSKNQTNSSCINPTPTPQPTPTKTPTPTKVLISTNLSPTAAINSSINKSSPVSINQLIDTHKEGEVLGTNTEYQKAKHPVIYLSLTSFSYSLLTIFSVFLKMKKGI